MKIEIIFNINICYGKCQDGGLRCKIDWWLLSILETIIKPLCSSNPCRFEFLVFGVFDRIEPKTSKLTFPRSDQAELVCTLAQIGFVCWRKQTRCMYWKRCMTARQPGHQGVWRTLAKVMGIFYGTDRQVIGTFYGTGDVVKYVEICHPCQISQIDSRARMGELRVLPVPEAPWDMVHMDWITGSLE